ncbi:MAG: DUF1775 domain-containing protein [Pseudomonadota bacterium]
MSRFLSAAAPGTTVVARAGFAATVLLLWGLNSAHAHATLEQQSAAAGTTYKGVMRIGHGCEGEATLALEVHLPDGFINAKPMPKPGWTLETETGAYDQTYDYHGRSLSEGVRVIRWTGGSLSDEHYDEFVFRGALRGQKAGEIVAFPTVQLCANGRNDWVEIAAPGQNPHDLDSPAPTLTITSAQEHAGHNHEAAADGSTTVGDLVIDRAWTRQPPPAARVGGGYMRITNNGTQADRLIGGSAPFADIFEVHEMSVKDGVMRMNELPDGLKIPAGETVLLQPGGLHLMFIQLSDAPQESESVPVTLKFEKAGEVTLRMPVAAMGAQSLGAHGGASGDHSALGASSK